MPRTRHRHPLDVSFGQRGPHVRADVVDRRVFAADVEDSHHRAVDRKGSSFTGRNLADFGDGLKLIHCREVSFALEAGTRGRPEGGLGGRWTSISDDRYCKRTLAVRSTRLAPGPGMTR